MCAKEHPIRIQGLSHTHPGASDPVLRGVDFTAAPSEMTGISGPSGGGKTTLLNLIAGLLTPDAGSISVLGTDLTILGPNDRAIWRGETVGYAYQDSRLMPQLDVVTNVAWPLLFRDHSRQRALSQARELMDLFGLSMLTRQRPETLSGGEQRRIALARALIARPSLLLVDEPTANLDPKAAESVIELLTQVRHEFGMMVLLVSHHPEALARCHRRLTLREGALRESPAS